MKNVLKPKIKFLKGDNFLLDKRGLPVRRIFYKDSISLFLKKEENTGSKNGQ